MRVLVMDAQAVSTPSADDQAREQRRAFAHRAERGSAVAVGRQPRHIALILLP
jgi:hypothetical protein